MTIKREFQLSFLLRRKERGCIIMEKSKRERNGIAKLLNLFKSAIWKSKRTGVLYEVKSILLICKQQEELLKTYRQKNEILEEIVFAFKEVKQNVIDKCTSDLEYVKTKRTIEDLAVLIDKGVEIYSSIETPKEIKVLFPFEKDTAILPDNLLKMIEDKNDNKE